MLIGVLALVFLSGVTGLIYQVTWQKYLSIYLGSHALATALVLGVFFLFLSIGYWAAGRYISRMMKNKLLLYGTVELIIGLYALVSPNVFHALNNALSIHVETQSTNILLGLLFTSLYIGLPTFLMGVTIPVLTLGLSKSARESHRTHALIYGVNTLGAFVGTLIGGFWMIEYYGLPLTLMYVGVVNLMIFAGTAVLAARSGESFEGVATPAEKSQAPSEKSFEPSKMPYWLAYGISFLSGYYVFSFESLFIKMAGVAIGGSTYSFTVIVASFIAAIALGGLAIAKLKEKAFPEKVLLYTLLAAVVVGIGMYFVIPQWPLILMRVKVIFSPLTINFGLYWMAVLTVLVVILLPFVVLLGMNLPLLFAHIRFNGNLARLTGRLYAVNCAGCFIGAIFGGYVVFQYFSVSTAFKIPIFALGLSTLLLGWHVKNKLAAIAGGILALALTAVPSWSIRNFTPAFYFVNIGPAEENYLEAVKKSRATQLNISETIASFSDPNTLVDVVEAKGGERVLYLNGKPDAATNTDDQVRALAALVPLSIAPHEVKNVFIVGLGAGLSTAITSKFSEVQNVDVAEISQGVIDALPYFDSHNFDLTKKSSKYHLYNGDAYKILKDSAKKYDLIISETTHLWVSGVEKVYTYDFYKLASERLTDGGFYAQWFPAFNVSAEMFKTVLRGFMNAFPYTTVWATGNQVLCAVGSQKPYDQVDIAALTRRFNEQKDLYNKYGLNHPESILYSQLLSSFMVYNLISTDDTLHTLENPILEYSTGRTLFSQVTVNLEDLVWPLNRTMALNHVDKNTYLSDSLHLPLDVPPLLEAIKNSAAINLRFFRDRLEHLFFTTNPAHPAVGYSSVQKKLFGYLTSKHMKNPLTIEEGQSLLDQPSQFSMITNTLRTLYDSHVAVNFENLRTLFGTPCGTSNCVQIKIQMGKQFGQPKYQKEFEALALEPTEKVKAEASNLFEKAFTAP